VQAAGLLDFIFRFVLVQNIFRKCMSEVDKVALGEIRTAASEPATEEVWDSCATVLGLAALQQHHRCQPKKAALALEAITSNITMFVALTSTFNLVTGYAAPYDTARGVYLTDAEALKEATGPYKAARDAYVAATATYTKSLYE
jgi:hypothetical protein